VNFDWNDLAFASKKPLNSLKATFIAAPRELSNTRCTQLVKQYLPKGNMILGIAKEPFVLGFEDQPQFKTLQRKTVQSIIDKVNSRPSKYKIATLVYAQRDLLHVINGLSVQEFIFINGSWKYSFHTQAPYYALVQRGTPFTLVSPFANEDEAKAFGKKTKLPKPPVSGTYDEVRMLEIAARAAKQSYDYSFQTGVSLGKKQGGKYRLLATTFNPVVPYQTYAMHFGASREVNFSPPHDLNHYDTTHAEVELIIKAQKEQINLQRTTLFINLLPCPSCARMLSRTDITEFVYREDHSDGYAIKMLEAAGKKVRRIVA
jgi:deoxycytidylate deaminase